MAEAEILELIAIYTTNALTSLTVYVSFTFGYLTVAYFVGSKLSRFQVLAASGIYTVSAFGMMFSTVGNVEAWSALKSKLPQDSEILTSLVWSGSLWVVCIPIGLTLGIIISLYFMYDCRKSVSDGGT